MVTSRMPVYLASCPFCDYRRLFTSEFTMLRVYRIHLMDHMEDAVGGAPRRESTMTRLDALARHLKRLNTAQFN